MNPGMTWNVASQFFLSIPYYSVTKTSWLVVLAVIVTVTFMQLKDLGHDHNSSLLLKPSPNLELSVNPFNNENSNDPGGVNFKYLPWRGNLGVEVWCRGRYS